MPTFIAHGEQAPQTDVDVLGVRFPYSQEYPDDEALGIPAGKIDIVFGESRAGRCRLNGPWKAENPAPLKYVLRRVGIFEDPSEATTKLLAEYRYEAATCVIRIVCFGGKRNSTLSAATQILWTDVLKFISHRFQRYAHQKAEHQTWDSFGQYLWKKLRWDNVPEIKEVVEEWNADCSGWPDSRRMAINGFSNANCVLLLGLESLWRLYSYRCDWLNSWEQVSIIVAARWPVKGARMPPLKGASHGRTAVCLSI